MTIEEVIAKYDNLKEHLGRPPSSTEFYKASGVSKRTLGKLLSNEAWSKLVSLCGDMPNKFSKPKSDFDEILNQYGHLTRKIGRLPLIVDWDNSGLRPSVDGIKKSHNLKWSELSSKFYQFATDNINWADIINLFSTLDNKITDNIPINDECFVYLMLDSKTKLYKIGISKTVQFREKTLQSEKPSIRMIAAKKFINRRIAANFEKALHVSYSHKRERGEWFLLNPEDLNEIKTTLDS